MGKKVIWMDDLISDYYIKQNKLKEQNNQAKAQKDSNVKEWMVSVAKRVNIYGSKIDRTFILMYTPASVLIFVVTGKVISSIKEDEYFDQPSFSLTNILISQALIQPDLHSNRVQLLLYEAAFWSVHIVIC